MTDNFALVAFAAGELADAPAVAFGAFRRLARIRKRYQASHMALYGLAAPSVLAALQKAADDDDIVDLFGETALEEVVDFIGAHVQACPDLEMLPWWSATDPAVSFDLLKAAKVWSGAAAYATWDLRWPLLPPAAIEKGFGVFQTVAAPPRRKGKPVAPGDACGVLTTSEVRWLQSGPTTDAYGMSLVGAMTWRFQYGFPTNGCDVREPSGTANFADSWIGLRMQGMSSDPMEFSLRNGFNSVLAVSLADLEVLKAIDAPNWESPGNKRLREFDDPEPSGDDHG